MMRPTAKSTIAVVCFFNVAFLPLVTHHLNQWKAFLTPQQQLFRWESSSDQVVGNNSTWPPERNQSNSLESRIVRETTYTETPATKELSHFINVSVIVDLSGELGNHLNHIAHGHVIQKLLEQNHDIVSHLILRRNSHDEKYQRTQRQLKKCFPNLRHLIFHDPKSSTITSQKTLDRIQTTKLGQEQAHALFLNGGASLENTQQSVLALANLVRNYDVHLNETEAIRGTSLPFVRTSAMINREIMDTFYDDLRTFFEFDEAACCIIDDLPDPNISIFHFRNFFGELKQGKSTGLEELSAHKVATELFSPTKGQNNTSIAIATRFPGRKASQEYFDALIQQGFDVQWLTVKDSKSDSPPSAMHDFCAMRRTMELVGMARSTFVVWAAFLGNPHGKARLYSVDSAWTRKKFIKTGRPIFRTYNWTNPELKSRIHFELYEAEAIN